MQVLRGIELEAEPQKKRFVKASIDFSLARKIETGMKLPPLTRRSVFSNRHFSRSSAEKIRFAFPVKSYMQELLF